MCQAQVKMGLSKLDLLVIKDHLPCVTNLRSSSISKMIEVVFLLWKTEVVFFLEDKMLYIDIIEVVFSLLEVKVVFYLQQSWGCLPFKKLFRSSSVYKKKEVIFHFKLIKAYLNALVYIWSHIETIPGGWWLVKNG